MQVGGEAVMGEAGVGRGPKRWRLLAVIGSLVVVGAVVGASRVPPLRRAYFLWRLERSYLGLPPKQAAGSPEFSRVMYYQRRLMREGEPVVQPLLARRHKYDYLWYWTTTTAAGALGSPQAEPAFVEDTRSEDVAVVCQALSVLGALPELHCQDRVLELLASPTAEVREKALQLVAKHRIGGAYPMVVAMLRSDPEPTVRGLATQALARVAGREAIPLLIQALDDPGVTQTPPIVTVRSAAEFCLSALTGKSFATRVEWERWWQEEQAAPGARQPDAGARQVPGPGVP